MRKDDTRGERVHPAHVSPSLRFGHFLAEILALRPKEGQKCTRTLHSRQTPNCRHVFRPLIAKQGAMQREKRPGTATRRADEVPHSSGCGLLVLLWLE